MRRSDRARRVRVTVDAVRGVEVVLPRRAAEREAAAAIRELRPWIERRVAELAGARAAVAARGDTVPYLGRTLALVSDLPVRTARGATRRHVARPVPAISAVPALERWYRRAARAEIEPRLQRACAQAGTSYSKLTIRGQRTRWASCSRSGRDELQLAAAAGARAGARLRGLARGVPPRGDGSLHALLAAAGRPQPRAIASMCGGCAGNGATLVLWSARSREHADCAGQRRAGPSDLSADSRSAPPWARSEVSARRALRACLPVYAGAKGM